MKGETLIKLMKYRSLI